jgi:hypothetical protein
VRWNGHTYCTWYRMKGLWTNLGTEMLDAKRGRLQLQYLADQSHDSNSRLRKKYRSYSSKLHSGSKLETDFYSLPLTTWLLLPRPAKIIGPLNLTLSRTWSFVNNVNFDELAQMPLILLLQQCFPTDSSISGCYQRQAGSTRRRIRYSSLIFRRFGSCRFP